MPRHIWWYEDGNIPKPMQCLHIWLYTFRKNATKTQYLITVSWGIQPEYGSVRIDTEVVFIIAHPGRKETRLHTMYHSTPPLLHKLP